MDILKKVRYLFPYLCRGKYPPASEYVRHADRSTASLVETFRSMQLEEELQENGDLDYEVSVNYFPIKANLLQPI